MRYRERSGENESGVKVDVRKEELWSSHEKAEWVSAGRAWDGVVRGIQRVGGLVPKLRDPLGKRLGVEGGRLRKGRV